jgi:hypothetical protein
MAGAVGSVDKPAPASLGSAMAGNPEPSLRRVHSLQRAASGLLRGLQRAWSPSPRTNSVSLHRRVSMAPVGDRCELLACRQFVTSMARLSEGLVMHDITRGFFPIRCTVDELQRRLSCSEKAAFFAKDKVGEITMLAEERADHCEVRRRRAAWALDLDRRYRPEVIAWIDTQVGLEKQVAIVCLRPPDQQPILVVAFRGSKKVSDYLVTDANLAMASLPPPRLPSAEAPGTSTGRSPSCAAGVWRAYAGASGRESQGPRALVHAAIEKALAAEGPGCRLCITGHSLGGGAQPSVRPETHLPAATAGAEPEAALMCAG